MLSATMIAPCASFGCSSSNTGTYRFFHRSISTKSNGPASCPSDASASPRRNSTYCASPARASCARAYSILAACSSSDTTLAPTDPAPARPPRSPEPGRGVAVRAAHFQDPAGLRFLDQQIHQRAGCPTHRQQHLIAPPHTFLGRQRAPELLLTLRPCLVLLEYRPHLLVHRSLLTARRKNTPATRRPPAASLRTGSRDVRAS